MAGKVNWSALGIAIIAGIVIGAGIPRLGVLIGLPRSIAGPIGGGAVAALIPLAYRLQTRRSERQSSAAASGQTERPAS